MESTTVSFPLRDPGGTSVRSRIAAAGPANLFLAEAYEYDLPPALIAQQPLEERDHSRLMVLERVSGRRVDSKFHTIRDFLRDGDLIVVNNSKVFPARIVGRKASGGRVELLLLRPCLPEGGDLDVCQGEDYPPGPDWECLIRTSARIRPGQKFFFPEDVQGEVVERPDPRVWKVRFNKGGPDFFPFLERFGLTPLPPYIKRGEAAEPDSDLLRDRQRYQTVFAKRLGSAAAPTAGFHFSEALCRCLREAGIGFAEVTLHVGESTFLPIRACDIRDHQVRAERVFVSQAAAAEIQAAKQDGRRVVAVGTTVVRCLESVVAGKGKLVAGAGWADLYITPGFRFQVVDALLTNFHLPRSSLLVLVCAFAGRESVMEAYREAVQRGYRFFSYGDCMLIQTG